MNFRVLVAMAAVCSLSISAVAFADPEATPAAPADSAAPAPTAPKSSARDPNQVVCKTVEVVGTRLGGGRICKTRAEWAQTRRDAHDATEDAQRNALQANPKGN